MEEYLENPKLETSCYFCERKLNFLTFMACTICKPMRICVVCFSKGK